MWLSPQVIVSGWVYKTIVIESFFNMALHNKALINQCLQACWNPFTLSPGRDPWAERWFPSITHHALRISSQSPDPGLLLASPLSRLQWFYYITVSQKDSVGPSEPEMSFLPFIFFKPLSKNSKRGLKKKKKANNNNQKLESSSLLTLLPECNLRRCTKNVKNEQIGMSVSVLQGWDGLTRRWSLKCLGLTVLLLTLRAMVLVLILGCKTAHWSTLGRKSLFSDSTSTAEAPMAEASLWPVCAISGLGAFMSSSRSSDWSRLIWRILTTKDALCQARKCLSPLFTRESENL